MSRSIGATVRQVTKSNFAAAIHQIKADIEASDFVAVSTRKTGDSSASSSQRRPWWRILPIDTPDIAYLKSKLAADSFHLLQFAVCPFSIRGSKVVALPYNFHLFPRDELSLGMPCYRFSCQPSFLTCMAREGFDFNACVYDGISYLSRVQESRAREINPRPSLCSYSSSQTSSVADSLFKERIKSRISHWRNAFKDSTHEKDGSLAQTLRKLILGSQVYGSRPGMSIDICNEKQMHLVFQVVKQISEDLVPIYIPDNGGQPKAVRVVLTASEDDKKDLLTEIQNLEDEQNLKLRGFRQVIDLISSSHKTVVSHNCLHDFTFIHEKFLGPLPATLPEFMCSLRLLFSKVIDLNHLLKEIAPLRKAKSIPSALSYLRRQFFVPMELVIPREDHEGSANHGKNVVSIAFLFSKLKKLLKTAPFGGTEPIEDFANIFHTASMTLHNEPGDDDDDDDGEAGLSIDSDTNKRVSTDDILFLWGFHGSTCAAELKNRLFGIHAVLSEDFDVRIVDKTCAVVVFKKSGSAEILLKDMDSAEAHSGGFREMVAGGLRAARYDAYKKVCKVGLWEGELADSLEIAMADSAEGSYSSSQTNTDEIRWNRELMIDLNEL